MSAERPLTLAPEEMRRLGHAVVDLLVDRLTDEEAPVLRRATPDEMAARLHAPPPEEPTPFETVLERLERDVLPFASRCDHPGYLAYIPSSSTWPGALGDLIASALSIYAGSWMESAGPSQLELTVLDWFKDWIAYPSGAAGILLSGGSAANLTALACARESLLGAMTDRVSAYVPDQAHSSLARAARTLGFRPDQVRVLPTGDDLRMRPEVLDEAIRADLRAGRQPLAAVGVAGSTNTGAVDPLADLAAVCREHGVWLHVDAAYGGFAALTERGQRLLSGIELADSVTLDPHKWLFQPIECGTLLVRDGGQLRRSFEIVPDYLADAEGEGGEVNFSDRGLQLTRTARAIKVWSSIQTFGLGAFRRAIDGAMDLALLAQQAIEESDALELLSPAQLGIVCFRRRFGGDERANELGNAGLAADLEATGRALISSTRLRGRYALRMCILNPATREEDVRFVLDRIAGSDPPAAASAEPSRRDGTVRAWGPDVAELGAIPLLEDLDAGGLRELAARSHVRRAAADETIVAQWEASQDFYIVVEGEVRVLVDDREVATLATGDFFGELAALDWGAGFGYPRLASVVATGPTRLLVIPPGGFNEVMRRSESFAARIREAVRDRLRNP